MRKLLYILLFVGFYSFAQSPAIQTKILRLEASSLIEMNAFTRMEEGSLCWRTDLKELFAYDGASWVQKTGLSSTYTAGDGIDITGSVISEDGSNVKLTGTQTITGTKYFNSQIRIGNYLSSNDHAVRIANDGVQISSLNRQNSWYIFNNLGYADDLKDEGRISIYPDDEFIQDRAFYFDYEDDRWEIGESPIITQGNASGYGIGSSGGTDDQNASEVPITDTADNFTATDVEGALAELAGSGVGSGFGIVAEGIQTTSSGTGIYTVSHNLGYIPEKSRIQLQEVDSDNGQVYVAAAIRNITSTTFDIETTTNTSFSYAWRIFGSGSIVGQTASEVTYDNTTSGLTATDVQDAIDELSAGGISDSGQGMATQTLTDVTETFDNADVTVGGVDLAERMFNKASGTNLITLDGTITNYNQPFLLYHDSGVGSTTIKKGVGTTFKVADLGILADDGLTFDNYGNMTIIALANNEYLISCSSCDPYTETSGLNNAADVNNEINGTSNTSSPDGEITWTSQSSNVFGGSYALRATKTGGTDDDVSIGNVTLIGVSNGDSVTVTFRADESSTQGTNWQYRASVANGWTTQTLVGISGTGYQYYQFTETATQDNPVLSFETTTVGDVNDILDVDNITYTIN